MYADPVQPARSSGLLGFDVGVAATVLKVDTNADYWKHSVTKKITVSGGYVGVPRLVVSKGWGGGTISGTYAKITDTGAKTYGGSIDLPIIRGTVASPELALRGAYSTVTGVDVFKLKTYGVEAFVSKGFGPLMPYIAAGRMRSDSRATVDITGVPPPQSKINFKAKSDMNRYTVGLRISLFLPKIVVEATQAEQRSYSAKVSIGF